MNPNRNYDLLWDILASRFASLPETGVIDKATKILLQTDRCGVPDLGASFRVKRWVLQGSTWKKNVSTYMISVFLDLVIARNRDVETGWINRMITESGQNIESW